MVARSMFVGFETLFAVLIESVSEQGAWSRLDFEILDQILIEL